MRTRTSRPLRAVLGGDVIFDDHAYIVHQDRAIRQFLQSEIFLAGYLCLHNIFISHNFLSLPVNAGRRLTVRASGGVLATEHQPTNYPASVCA